MLNIEGLAHMPKTPVNVIGLTDQQRRLFVGEISERVDAARQDEPEPMTNISARVPLSVAHLLTSAAHNAGVTKSDIVRMALIDWINDMVNGVGGEIDQIELPLEGQEG